MIITPEAIWLAYENDKFHQPQPAMVLQRMKPFVMALPLLLADRLDLPANLPIILEARIDFLRYCLAYQMAEVMLADKSDRRLRSIMTAKLNRLLENIIQAHEEILADVPAFLAGMEITEDEYVVSQFELNQEMSNAYYRGTLTIGQLLLDQPLIFVRHT